MNKNLKSKLMLSTAVLTAVSVLGITPTHAEDNTAVAAESQNDTAYEAWYQNEWNNKAETHSDNVMLTPGVNERSLNFAWYSVEAGNPQVRISAKEDMSDAQVFTGKAAAINKTNGFETYTASNKVSVDNYFNENSTYYYQTSINGTEWSEPEVYTTHSFSQVKALVVGDPQIGASGSHGQGTQDDLDVAQNTFAWQNTLNNALNKVPDVNFILSAGDQINQASTNPGKDGKLDDYTIREQEYAGYTYPEQLRNIPVATTIGNHESKGDDYSLHYNNPNETSLGMTNSGGDYYYSYGNTLFISLNSNNRNMEEHRKAMQAAKDSAPETVWTVVMFHHDIYGTGAPHSDVDGANLRILFAPLMDEFGVDVCFNGHDHSYARTFQIEDGKILPTEGIVDGEDGSCVDPDGTLYVAAGSATGSKFYNLDTTKQYYLADRNGEKKPSYSVLDINGNTLSIKTYDDQGNKYAKDVTITKTADDQKSLTELKNEVMWDDTKMTVGSNDLRDDAVYKADTVLAHADDPAYTDLQAKFQNGEGDDPLDYYAYAKGEYQNPNGMPEGEGPGSETLKAGYSTLLDKTLYEAAQNTPVDKEAYEKAREALINAKEQAVTLAEVDAFTADLHATEEKLSQTKPGVHTQGALDAMKADLDVLEKDLLNPKDMIRDHLDSMTKRLEGIKASLDIDNGVDTKPAPTEEPTPAPTADTGSTPKPEGEKVKTGVATDPLAYAGAAIAAAAGLLILKKRG